MDLAKVMQPFPKNTGVSSVFRTTLCCRSLRLKIASFPPRTKYNKLKSTLQYKVCANTICFLLSNSISCFLKYRIEIMPTIIYYISGHGYGHSTRSIELIKTLLRKNPDLFCHIRTDAPKWIFELNLDSNYEFHNVRLDIGAVQETSFHIDKKKTFDAVTELYKQKEQIVKRESTFATRAEADLIIADIPPLAFDIAKTAGIPGIGLGNFCWDWIYQDYVAEIAEFGSLVNQIKSSYNKAHQLLRLPFYGDMSAFANIFYIPLIGRKANMHPKKVLQRLGIESKQRDKLILLAFRPNDLTGVDFERIKSMRGFQFVTLGLPKAYKNCINIPPDFIRFPDLLNACDAAISKPGYGLVAEVIANQTPLLYTSRIDFAEYEFLVKGLKEYAVARELPRRDFFAGNWQEHLETLLHGPFVWKPIELDGADKAADAISDYFR